MAGKNSNFVHLFLFLDFVGDNKIEILPIELPDNLSPKQVNGVPDKPVRSVISSDMMLIPHVTIKEEPLDELLEEAERYVARCSWEIYKFG